MENTVRLPFKEYLVTPFLFLTYGIFLMGFFYIPNAIDHFKFFTLAIFLPGLMVVTTGFQLLKKDRLFLLILLYLGYMLISSFWSEPFNLKEFIYYIKLTLYVLMFIMLTVVLQQKYPDKFFFLLQAVCAGAALAAVLSIYLWYQVNPFPDSRLIGLGTLVNPNPSGHIYGFFLIFAMDWALRAENFIERIWYLLIVTVLLCFVLLTQSRTAIIAVILSAAVFFSLFRREKSHTFFYWLIVLLLVVGILSLEILPSLINRDTSARMEIWNGFINHVIQAPLFGYGYLNNIKVYVSIEGAYYDYAHSAFLASLRDGGIVGLGLLIAILGYAGYRVLQINSKEERTFNCVLLAYAMPSMLWDTNKLITRPNEIWFVLWFVLALIMTHHRAKA